MDPIERALRRPEAYPHRPPSVEVRETHASLVFLAGDLAYKVKKPVRYPFLDYSTLERRRFFCEEEVRLNRRLAPSVYLGVVPVTADLRIGGEGEPVEYAVVMRRLPQDRMLDEMLRRDEVTEADVLRIADAVADFHARADRSTEHGRPEDVRRVILGNLDDASRFLRPAWRERLRAESERLLADAAPLLERRRAEGRVRDGHGDLHAGNVCLPSGEIVIYDCIEFEPVFRIGDVAAEIAFLAMDLERYGAWDLARSFVRRYAERAGDAEAEGLVPLFQRYRACVRGLVESLRSSPSAGAYFRLALSYGLGPFALLTCGLPGTGKSRLAREAARAFGAEILRSDVVRKEIAGIAPAAHWRGGYSEGPYRAELTERTYAVMRARAGERLRAGRRVVVDATFARRAWRDAFRAAAREAGVPCLVVHVVCPEDVVRARMAARAGDRAEVSDADFAVYLKARDGFEEPRAPDAVHDGTAAPDGTLDRLVDRLVDSLPP
jgi:aminoglycoside phosphotransferase family enzyme/predicted kinase